MSLCWQRTRWLLVLPLVFVATFSGLHSAVAEDAYSTAVLSDAPVAYWRLNEMTGTTARDSSGHGNDASIRSGVTLGGAGAVIGSADPAMSFDGSSAGVITLATVSGLTGGSHAFTAEAWVKLDPSVTSNTGVLAWGGGTAGSQTNLWLNSDRAGDLYPSTSLLASNLGDLRGAWQHLVLTWDGTTRRLYVDTALVAQDTPTGVNMQLNNLTVGDTLYSYAAFKGSIDEVAIYDSALSAARILAHHSAATGGNAPVPTDAYGTAVLADNPAAYWRLDESSGLVAFDSSGHANDLVLGSGVTHNAAGVVSGHTAATFDGSSYGLARGFGFGLTGGSHAFTAEAWVKLDPSVTSNTGVLAWGGGTAATQTNLWLNSDRAGDLYPSTSLLASNLGDLRGAWQHLVLTWDGTTRRLYLNSIEVARDTPTGVDMQLSNLTVGDTLYSYAAFKGSIDEVAIYDSALSLGRIKAHYATAILSLPRALAEEIVSAQTVRPHECPCKDPVSTATGTYARTWTDLQVPGVGGGLSFARSYRSTSDVISPLAKGWTTRI